MLIRFEIANFRSILEPAELSMVAVDQDRPEARPAPGLGVDLVPVAAIYGPNASGKSNILAGLAWLSSAVRDSLVRWDEQIPLEKFAFADALHDQSEFSVDWLIDGIRHEYSLRLNARSVTYEGLFHYPEKKRRRLFERHGEELVLQRGLGHLSGTRELLTPRTLALSIVRRFDDPAFQRFIRELLAVRTPRGSGRTRFLHRYRSTHPEWPWLASDGARQLALDDLTDGDVDHRSQALALLRLADLGVDDVAVEREESGVISTEGTDRRVVRYRTRLLHRTTGGVVPLDMNQESEGTQAWFHLIGPTLSSLRDGSVLLLDELDASLHPTLSAEIVRLFHDPATNPNGAQLIFTSHDTSLLGHLNRDEVWLTEKDERGATRLGALSDFAGERVRRSQNLERGYLHGRFGALPDVDRAEVLRTLGLIG